MALIQSRDSKDRLTLVITGRALYPKLTRPDTKYKAVGEYGTKIVLDSDDVETLQEILEEARQAGVQMAVAEAKEKGKVVKADKVKLADLSLTELTDKEGEPTGEWAVNVKAPASGTTKDGRAWARKIPLFDAKAKPIANPGTLDIWSGSLLRVNCWVKPFYTAALGAGASLRLVGVQILELATGGSRDADSLGFGAEDDGYEYGEQTEPGTDPFEPTEAGDPAEADF